MSRKTWINAIDNDQAIEISKVMFPKSQGLIKLALEGKLKSEATLQNFRSLVRKRLRGAGVTERDYHVVKGRYIVQMTN